MKIDYSALPEHLQAGAQRYIEHGIEPGSFLTAVIQNDLREACIRADGANHGLLFTVVKWFYSESPSQCWGSVEKFNKWLAR